MTRRVRARVEGVVQGVGYRPFVYRLAGELGVDGWVLNDSRGVLVEAEGEEAVVDDFVARLASDAPPLASVERVTAEDVEPEGADGFEIRGSEGGEPDALVVARRGHLRRLPGRGDSTPATAATATRSPTAPTAGRGSRSSPACPTTGR